MDDAQGVRRRPLCPVHRDLAQDGRVNDFLVGCNCLIEQWPDIPRNSFSFPDMRKTDRVYLRSVGAQMYPVRFSVHMVRPYGVDVASGVESAPGRTDAEKMRRFLADAREAAALLLWLILSPRTIRRFQLVRGLRE
jgi:hypothetical protein